jgi:hypothetical protein
MQRQRRSHYADAAQVDAVALAFFVFAAFFALFVFVTWAFAVVVAAEATPVTPLDAWPAALVSSEMLLFSLCHGKMSVCASKTDKDIRQTF